MSRVSARAGTEHITKTKFWDAVMTDVFGARQGGCILFVDAENSRKGVAKTSCACALARLFSQAFGYDLQKSDLTLSGTEYLRRYQEHPGAEQPSVLILDEFVGAGAGDKRRSMAQQNVDFGRAWSLLRTKRVITIATCPSWVAADLRLRKLADYRVWCREKPIGTFQPYKVTVPFNGGSGVRTKGLGKYGSSRRIQFPNMDAENDRFYRDLTEKKDELIHSGTWDADNLLEDQEEPETRDPEQIRREEAIRYAIRLYEPWDDSNDRTYKEVASVVDGYKKSWVGDRVKEWRDGEHRELVPEPAVA